MDLVTFGEAMVRLSPPGFQRLEQARSLDVHVGGSELNVAVGAARLGLACAWESRLTDNALGRLIAMRAREQGVDVSRVVWTPEQRAGVYFVEFGAAPRATSVLYDRSGSAMSHIAEGMFDWSASFAGARWFHTSGITPALSDSAAAATAQALSAAKQAGLTVSYDLNFRAKLWNANKARAVQEPLMHSVDVLITSLEGARVVFGIVSTVAGDHESASAEQCADVGHQLQKRFGVKAVAFTLRENPRVWLNSYGAIVVADGTVHTAPHYEVEIVDPIGAGDAFNAGLIYGRLTHGDWAKAASYGTALAALKHTVPGDFSGASLTEVEQLMKGGSLGVNR